MTVGCLSGSREIDRSKRAWVLDLPSESREKIRFKKVQWNCHARWGAQHMYNCTKPTTETRTMSGSAWLLSEQPAQPDYCSPARTGIRIIALATRKGLHASQSPCDRKARAEIVQHTTTQASHFPPVTRPARAVAPFHTRD